VLWIAGLTGSAVRIIIFEYIVLGHETMINSGWRQNQHLRGAVDQVETAGIATMD
jgi:hypothetical protein